MSTSKDQRLPAKAVSGFQIGFLTCLRVAIGWHFLYEGLLKVFDPTWSAAGYLSQSKWFLSDIFRWIAQNNAALTVVDILNQLGLVLVGLGLMLGLFTRTAAVAGAVLLGLYYVANPPFLNVANAEGSYLFVDKNLVELFALLVILAFPTGLHTGLDRLLAWRRARKSLVKAQSGEFPGSQEVGQPVPEPALSGRRDMLKSLASLPFLGAFAYAYVRRHSLKSFEEIALVSSKAGSVDGVTGATLKRFSFSGMEDLKGEVPKSKIGELELSRVILGGNLIGGWAHARDLIYVSNLVKAYHHERKIFETLQLAERCGINTILTNPVLSTVINKYWRRGIGNIQFISDCALKGNVFDGIKMSVENGAHACYVQGGIADRLVANGKIDEIGKALELIRREGLPAGIGAHELETVQACVEAGFKPDFWMKTLHTSDYWSATPTREHNNIWCTKPEATVEYMKECEEPWIAFKVLAAGALDPKKAFRYAFESGADFICVGMYDFQVVDDVNLALDALNGDLEQKRKRPWRAV